MEFVNAQTLGEVKSLIADGKSRILAGGTDLALDYRRQLPDWPTLIHVGAIPELTAIEISDQAITIGSAATYTTVAELDCGDGGLAALRDAAWTIGSLGIMNFGTLGGNLGTASPAGDGSLALLVLDAAIVLASLREERTIPIEAFFQGPRRSVARPDEVIVTIRVPRSPGRRGGAFRKLGNREGSVLSVASAAVVLDFDETRCVKARVAFGSVAPVPTRAPAVEEQLLGRTLEDIPGLDLRDAVAGSISPIDDQRSKAWYRREVAPILLRDALAAACDRMANGGAS